MKNILLAILITFCFCGCSEEEPIESSVATGDIYGVVTVKSTAEPMRATGVELYYDNALLLKTVTYDDGHYEFYDLKIGAYELRVVAEGYADVGFRVIVENGRTARADMQLTEIETHMTVRTLDITDIQGDKVTLNGTYTYRGNNAPQEVGFFYATHITPIIRGTKIKAAAEEQFSAAISDLAKGTYYVQAYAKNSWGISYGEQRTFKISGDPIVSTFAVTNITEGYATLNGKIEYAGDPTYTERGFVYSEKIQNPTLDNYLDCYNKIVSGDSPDFSAVITWSTWGHQPTTYYIRAYAKNKEATVYGESVNFTTK
ncbi:MAG: carboxypeptidase-like regulatory domain-containing protein [Muribaculaceae bacterium]|nr:carboxypeptidase-like regulatory domain-containing protein [Muribaculaceae bacterium]